MIYLKNWITAILIFFMFSECKNAEKLGQEPHVTSTQHYIPLIRGEQNSVVQLTMELKEAGKLNAISLEIENEEIIDSLYVFIKGEEGKLSGKEPIAGLTNLKKSLQVDTDLSLDSGKHHLWITIVPKRKADLLERINVNFKSITLGKNKITPEITNNFKPLRLAHKLRHHGDDGVHSYRIPGLATTEKGTLIAVYDARWNKSGDLQGDIDVGMSRSTDGGQSWQPMKIIMDMKEWGGKPENENGIGDPAVLVDRESNTIWVVALWMHGNPGRAWDSSSQGMKPEETGQLVLVKSEDDGLTWSEPINITSQVKKPEWHLMFNGPGKGITMKDGTLVFAAQFKDKEKIPHSTIVYSKDKGKTWSVGTGAKPNTTEAQVVELSDGRLMLNMRDNRGGARSVAVTNDLGKTWVEHPTSRKALLEPVCMASIITHQSGKYAGEDPLLFFSNPAATDGRYNIMVKASTDNGSTWPEKYHLLLDDKRGWGYSCLTSIDEDHLGILYESSRANMTFQIIPVEDIITSGN
jgi:sialidase-1